MQVIQLYTEDDEHRCDHHYPVVDGVSDLYDSIQWRLAAWFGWGPPLTPPEISRRHTLYTDGAAITTLHRISDFAYNEAAAVLGRFVVPFTCLGVPGVAYGRVNGILYHHLGYEDDT